MDSASEENMSKEASSGVLKNNSDRRIVTGTKGESMEVAMRHQCVKLPRERG